MNVHVIDRISRKEICEIESIARSLLCLNVRPVFALMLLDEMTRPSTSYFRLLFRDSQDFLWRCVMNGCA